MPIYEYRCQSCGHQMEALQKISEPPLSDCPECHQPALSKLISAAAFRLSGGGWYETDFKKSNKRNLAGDSGSDSKKSDTAKPEKKTSEKKAPNSKSETA